MPTSHTVTSAADLLSVSPSHLRRTADAMADILPDYQPLPGQARRFSDNDLRTLQAIFTRLETTPGLTRAQLLSELSAPGSEPLVIPETLPTKAPSTSQDSPGRAIPSQPIQTDVMTSQRALQTVSDIRRIVEPLSALPGAVERMADRIAALESQPAQPTAQERPERMIAAVLISLGVIFATVLFAALVWPMAGLVGLVIVAAVLVWGIAPLRTRG